MRNLLLIKVVSWFVFSPVLAQAQLHVSNVSKTGANQSAVVDTFQFILKTDDSSCKKWLDGVDATIPQLLGTDTSPDTVLIAHGDLYDGKERSSIVAFTGNSLSLGLPAGILMFFNDAGAFYTDRWAGHKVFSGGFLGGTYESRTLTALHELGHLLHPVGFQDDHDNEVHADKVEENNTQVKSHCGLLLKKAKDRGIVSK